MTTKMTSDERVTDDRQEMEERWRVEAADDALSQAHGQIGDAVALLQDHPNAAWGIGFRDRLIRLIHGLDTLRVETGEALDRC